MNNFGIIWTDTKHQSWAVDFPPPEREPVEEENEIIVRVRAIKCATKYLENNQNLVAIKMFNLNDDTKEGIRIDRKEEIFSKKTSLVLSKFKYRNNMGDYCHSNRVYNLIGITKKGGWIPLKD